jgi:hypothetical protein
MRDAWPEFGEEWVRLQEVAWERHPMHKEVASEPPEVEAVLALKLSSEVLIRAVYRTLESSAVATAMDRRPRRIRINPSWIRRECHAGA